MRFFEFLLVEAQGGMWDRMLEKKSGASIQFLNGNQTYELVDVAVFPQDQRLKYEPDPENPEALATDSMKLDIDQSMQNLKKIKLSNSLVLIQAILLPIETVLV